MLEARGSFHLLLRISKSESTYKNLGDLGDISFFEEAIEDYEQGFISVSYQKEIRSIANFSEYSENQILLTNLYYDALKFVFGCTSFAVQNGNKMIHARNLDWCNQAEILLQKSLPHNEIEALKILNHDKVRMNITVQQMVFDLVESKVVVL